MHDALQDALAPYDYAFPAELIAQEPAAPRDSARLLVYDRTHNETTLDTFAHIDEYLPPRCVLVLNETKVIPARMTVTIGEKTVDILCLGTEDDTIRALAPRTVRPGQTLSWAGHSLVVLAREGKEILLQPSFPIDQLLSLLDHHGRTPLPPYIDRSRLSEEERRREYQTVFAENAGSVAAPTAGLHFTPDLLERIRQSGRDIRTVTLHVGLGTFAPLTDTQLQTRTLHEERYWIDDETASFLNDAKADGRPIIAVGTTAVRALESASFDGETLTNCYGTTTLFLSPEHPPRFVDGLITNFHVPRSSLLMLVAGFIGRNQLMKLYQRAIAERFRLFSFGDGMLIL